jgi:hypothetical protein
MAIIPVVAKLSSVAVSVAKTVSHKTVSHANIFSRRTGNRVLSATNASCWELSST